MLYHIAKRMVGSWSWLGGVIVSFSLLACSPAQQVRGNLLDLDVIRKIEVNKTTKRELEELLGPPSSQELFSQDTWYYIGDKVEKVSFFDPKILERVLLIVNFGPNGTVSSYELKDLKDHHEVDILAESTPVKGRDPSLVSEIFGNVGRYAAPKRTAQR